MGIATTVVESLSDQDLETLTQAVFTENSLRRTVEHHNKNKGEQWPELPLDVARKILQSFPNYWASAIRNLRWSAIGNHWSFDFAGMYVGVEKDGDIHT